MLRCWSDPNRKTEPGFSYHETSQYGLEMSAPCRWMCACRRPMVHDSRLMPIVSIFLGIVVRLFHEDHPPPHMHAKYAKHRAIIDIAPGGSCRDACRPGFGAWWKSGDVRGDHNCAARGPRCKWRSCRDESSPWSRRATG